jgi:hypothetical protein
VQVPPNSPMNFLRMSMRRRNRRSIVSKLRLFAKNDRDNIDDRELRDFKKLARDYGKAKDADIDRMLDSKDLVEICND